MCIIGNFYTRNQRIVEYVQVSDTSEIEGGYFQHQLHHVVCYDNKMQTDCKIYDHVPH